MKKPAKNLVRLLTHKRRLTRAFGKLGTFDFTSWVRSTLLCILVKHTPAPFITACEASGTVLIMSRVLNIMRSYRKLRYPLLHARQKTSGKFGGKSIVFFALSILRKYENKISLLYFISIENPPLTIYSDFRKKKVKFFG